MRRARAVSAFGRRSITTSVSKKRCHGIPSASVVSALVWFVCTEGANGMPGKDWTEVKGMNAGRRL